MKFDFTVSVWTLVVTLGGWIVAALIIAWRLGAWVKVMELLRGDFQAHEEKDEKRFEGLTVQLRDLQLAEARREGRSGPR